MTWMVDVLKKINHHPVAKIHELLPHNWKELQQMEPVL